MSKRTHIELFAGCGGLNLGLETAGFELYFANELSPMAGETFAFNFLEEDLSQLAIEKNTSEKVLWINSNFNNNDLKDRLRENPFQGQKQFSDLDTDTSIEGKLLIGNIDNLIQYIKKTKRYKEIKDKDIDVLSGGPPCQSFSLAGKREQNNEKNLLPLSFATFAGLIKPKVVLLENVKGITIPFSEDGNNYYAWLEVSKTFALEGYYPICMMVNSKYFGIPQNRPRFILLGFRKDIFAKMKKSYNDIHSKNILEITESFYKKVTTSKNELDSIGIDDFKYFDIEKEPDFFDGLLLPKKLSLNNILNVADAIGDLIGSKKSEYVKDLNDAFIKNVLNKDLYNFETRVHSSITQARFRFYQILELIPLNYKIELLNLISQRDSKISTNELYKIVKPYKFLYPTENKNVEKKLRNSTELLELINIIKTKKHSQKALNKDLPAPAQLTIPDDICHYDINTPRVLTVREMARIQSFPDWFVFRSKVTTGGKMRSFETPQYTQVGNAVPPILGLSLGNLIANILEKIKE